MAKGIRYMYEFKQEAVNQIVKHGYEIAEVSSRLGVSIEDEHSSILEKALLHPTR